MSNQPFHTRFTEVVSTGDSVIRRLAVNGIRQSEIVDIIRVLVEAQLTDQMSETTNVDLASALVHLQELHPDHTSEKLILLKSLSSQVIDLATSINKDSEEEARFYRSLIGKKGSLFFALTKGVIECVHPDWTSTLKADKKSKLASIREEFIFSIIFYIILSLVLCANSIEKPTISDYCLSVVPVVGQLFNLFQGFGWHWLIGLFILVSFCMMGGSFNEYRSQFNFTPSSALPSERRARRG